MRASKDKVTNPDPLGAGVGEGIKTNVIFLDA
jgi:hypothetical protein